MTPTGGSGLDSPLTLTARCPEDLLAVVPVVLGFNPDDSVVMLTFGPPRAFHARADLPPRHAPPDAVCELIGSLLEPAVHHRVERVVFVIYADDPLRAERVCRRLVRTFRSAGIDVIDVLRSDGRRWYPMLLHRGVGAAGVPYDVTTHPFMVQAIVDGRVTHGSRTELAQSIAGDTARARRVAAVGRPVEVPTVAWVRRTTAQLAESGEVPDDRAAARLLVAVDTDPAAREAAWAGVARADTAGHVALWTDLVRRAPEPLLASAAAVLALFAWRSGHGALAWCAVDRAQDVEPEHPLACLVADLLVHAVPPDAWPDPWPDEPDDPEERGGDGCADPPGRAAG